MVNHPINLGFVQSGARPSNLRHARRPGRVATHQIHLAPARALVTRGFRQSTNANFDAVHATNHIVTIAASGNITGAVRHC
jgi:hypothetical protein